VQPGLTPDIAAPPALGGRIAWLDVARTIALVAMATFHFVFDLEAFGYLAPGTALTGGWAIFARVVASSFLGLVGIGLYLAHRHGLRWSRVWPRFLRIAGAAALISGATYFALGPQMIFFGILHEIAFASLVGLAFLRLPPLATAASAALVIALPRLVRLDLFGSPWLIWTGLGTRPTAAADFVPVFPWFGAVLAGLALAQMLGKAGFWVWLAARPAGKWVDRLGFPGRHSLVFYLIHQPILIGILWSVTKLIR
jgi:uncharacterized membrane protein